MSTDELPEEIKDLMRPAVTIEQTAKLRDALKLMIRENCNSLVVVDENGIFVGGLSALNLIHEVLPDYLEEDSVAAHFADESLLQNDVLHASNTLVQDFMSEDTPHVTEETSLIEAAVLASKKGEGRIAITDEDNRPIGVLTRTEIKQVIARYLDISQAPNDSA